MITIVYLASQAARTPLSICIEILPHEWTDKKKITIGANYNSHRIQKAGIAAHPVTQVV